MLGRWKDLPDQARGLVERVLEYDRRLSTERATVDGFFKDAEEHGSRQYALEEEAKRRARQDPDFLVTDLPGYRSLPVIPEKLRATERTIHKDEDTYGPHLDRIPDGREKLAAALERMVDPSRKSGGALHRLDCFCLEFDGACEVQRRVPTDWIIEPIDVSGHGSFSLAS